MGMVGWFKRIPGEEVNRLFSMGEEELLRYLDPEGTMEGTLDLDKSWDALFHLASWASDGEVDFPGLAKWLEHDLDFVPPWVFEPKTVHELARALEVIEVEKLLSFYDPERLNADEVYLSWSDDPEQIEYLREYYQQLRAFVLDAAAAGDGLVYMIC